MALQARLPAALAALHNFICDLNPFNLNDFQEAVDIEPGWRSGDLADGVAWQAERDRANNRHEELAEVMWVQYQEVLADHYHHGEMDINQLYHFQVSNIHVHVLQNKSLHSPKSHIE